MAKKRVWPWVAGTAALAVAGFYVAYRRSDVVIASDGLDREIALAQKMGICLDESQLHPKPIPADQNAAGYFFKAVREYLTLAA